MNENSFNFAQKETEENLSLKKYMSNKNRLFVKKGVYPQKSQDFVNYRHQTRNEIRDPEFQLNMADYQMKLLTKLGYFLDYIHLFSLSNTPRKTGNWNFEEPVS